MSTFRAVVRQVKRMDVWELAHEADVVTPKSQGAEFLVDVRDMAVGIATDYPDQALETWLQYLREGLDSCHWLVYTRETWEVFHDLEGWNDDACDEAEGMGYGLSDLSRAAAVIVFLMGERLGYHLLELLDGAREQDEDEYKED